MLHAGGSSFLAAWWAAEDFYLESDIFIARGVRRLNRIDPDVPASGPPTLLILTATLLFLTLLGLRLGIRASRKD